MTACSLEDSTSQDSAVLNTDIQNVSRNQLVTLSNVVALENNKNGQTRVAAEKDIICIVGRNSSDTLFFVVNHPDEGWTMYASDKRVPAVVAENPKGRFDLHEFEEFMGTWWEAMKEDMLQIRNAKNSELNFTDDEIEANCAVWDAVSSPNDFVCAYLTSKLRLPPPNFFGGHYELYNTYTDVEIYDSIGHLTITKWKQNSPYNRWCPMKSSGITYAPAGCVAVAGAQMLYFLYKKIGIPQNISDQAYCNSSVDDWPNYDWGQWYSGTNVWAQIDDQVNSYTSGLLIAPFIAEIGRLVNMKYGNDGSGAQTVLLKDVAFPHYGITCSYAPYDVGIVRNSLQDSVPVIASAYATYENNTYSNGHAFIIDRYRRSRTKYSYHYIWISDQTGPPFVPEPYHPEYVTIENSTPYITQIGMNWGWGDVLNPENGQFVNDTFYSPTGSWLVPVGNPPYSFDYNRYMIYDFVSE